MWLLTIKYVNASSCVVFATSVMKRFKANGASLLFDFYRASPEMVWLRLSRITNESTETENCY